MKIFFSVCLLFLMSNIGFAQLSNIDIKGSIDDLNTGSGLGSVTVSLYKDGTLIETVTTASNGKYKFKKATAGGVFTVKFSKPGYVGKYAEIDTKGIHPEDANDLPLEVNTSLFEQIPNVDFSVLDSKPVAKAKYDKDIDNIEWDITYIEKTKKEVEKIIAKAEEEKKKNADAAAATEKKFTDAVAAANAAMTKGDYSTAITKYNEALAVKDDADIKTKLKDAEEKKKVADANAEKDKQYNDLMAEAKKFFDAKDYASAKEKYQAASGVKTTETAPKEKIKEIDAILAKQLEEETKYNKFLADGEKAMLAENYDEAIKQFTEAGNLRKTEQLPKDQLKKAQDAKAAKEKDALAEKKKKEDFDKFVAAGDASNTGKKYDDAIANYDKALALIDDAAVKTKKENAIKAKEAEIAANQKLEEEKEKERIRKEEYDKLMKKGGEEMTATEYEKAIGTFESALIIFPKDVPAETKLAEAKKKRDEKLANEKLAEEQKKNKEKFDALVERGDGEAGKAEYDKAIATYKEALAIIKDEPGAKAKLADAEKKKADFVKNKADFDKLVSEGDAAVTGKKFEDAIGKYEKALVLFTDAAVQTKLDKAKADRDAANTALEAEKKKKADFDALLVKGDGEVKSESYDQAISTFEEALTLFPTDAGAKAKLADAKSKKEAKEKAALAEKDKAAKQEQFDKLVAQGDTEMSASTFDKAIASYTAALAIFKDDAGAKAKLAEAEKKKNDLAKNKADFDKLVTEGDAASNSKKFEDAIGKYEKALAIMEDAAVQTKLDKAKADRDLALGALEAEKKKKADFDALIAKGDGEVKSESFDDAITSFEEALKLFPADAGAKTKLADAKSKKEAKEKADLAAKDKLAKQEQFDKLIAQGDEEMNASTFDKAIASYTAALAIFKDDAGAKAKLADAQKKKNEADLANKSAEEQKRLAEEKYKKHYNDGMAHNNSSEFEKAITDFELALEAKPGDKDATDALAVAKQRLEEYKQMKDQAYKDRVALADKLFNEGNYTEAKTNYEKANKQRPDDEHPKNRITECDNKIKEKELADKSAVEKRKNYDAAKLKADELFKASKWDESIKQYELALTFLDEQYPKDQIELATTNKNNALNALEQEKQKRKEFDDLVAKGDTEVKSEDFDAAISSYESALKIIAKEPTAETKLADAKAKKAAKEKAELADKEKAAKREQFDKLIAQGDDAMSTTSYDNAITAYTAALAIFKDDAGAKTKLADAQKKKAEAENALKNEAEQKRLAEEKYKKHFNDGMSHNNSSEFEKAIHDFELALEAKPGDKEATDALATAKQRLEEYKQMKDQAYKDRVALADKLFNEENYAEAKTNYEKANKQRPDEAHPKDRIKECNDKLAAAGEMKKLREQFDAAMKNGDTELNGKNFDKAIAFYEAAKIILPNETTPDIKIEEAKRLKEKAKADNDMASKRKKFDELMNEGQTSMNGSEFDAAIAKFEEALTVIENEPTAIAAIKLAKERKAKDAEDREREYQRILEFADKEFGEKNWKDALKYYEKYLKYKKDDAYTLSQIEKCKAKIKEGEKNNATAGSYDALIKAGNKLFGEKKYKESREKFVDALAIYETMSYPKKKIDEIDKILNELAEEQNRENQEKINKEKKKEQAKGPDYGEKTMMSADDALALLLAAKIEDEQGKYIPIQNKKDKMSSNAKDIDKTSGETREENFIGINTQKDLQKDYSQNTVIKDENTELYRGKQQQLVSETRLWNSENKVDEINKALVQAQYDQRGMNQYEERIRIINSKDVVSDNEQLSRTNKEIDNQASEIRNANGTDLVAKKDLLNDRYSANGTKLIGENAKEINSDFETLNKFNREQNDQANIIREQNKIVLKEETDLFVKQNKVSQEKLLAENSTNVKNDFLNQHAVNTYINTESDKNRNENSNELNQRKDDFVKQNRFNSNEILTENSEEVTNKFKTQHDASVAMDVKANETRDKNGNLLSVQKDDFVKQQRTSQEKLLDANNAQVQSDFDLMNDQNSKIDAQSADIRNKNGEDLKTKKDILANTTNQTSDKLLAENNEQVKSDFDLLNKQNDQIDATAANIRNDNGEELTKKKDDLKNTYDKGAKSQADKIKLLKEQQEEQARQQKVADAKASKNRWANGQDLIEQKDQKMVYEKGQDGYKSSYTVDYPQGVTEEVYTRKDADQNISEVTVRRIVVKGDYGNEYRKVTSKTGTVYFKNGVTVTNQIWDMETGN